MTVTRGFRFPWIGVVLILVGGVLLLDRLHVADIRFSYVFWALLMVFGLIKVSQGFSNNSSGRVFMGTIFFLYGLYFLLRVLDYVEFRGHIFIPATFIIIGFAFIMTFLNNMREWSLLVPAILLMGIGSAYILSDMGYLYPWEVGEYVRMYWPVGLILVGIALLFRRRFEGHGGESPPPQAVTSQGSDVK